jgi:uncharacterized protein YraI
MPSLLRNPLVLGGLAVVLAAAAAVVMAVVMSDDETKTVVVATPPPQTSTPRGTRTPTSVALEGTTGRALSILTVRAGPGTGYISLGIAPRDSELDVVGKNGEGSWLEISYPPGSQLMGWVSADGVELKESLAGLPVATPESLVLPVVPTYAPGAFVEEDSGTPEAGPLPDLTVSNASLLDGDLVVTITNLGTADAAAPIDVAIYNGDGSMLLRLAGIGEPLPAGSSINLDTRYQPGGGQQRLLIRVDSSDRVQEADEDNNEVLFGVSGLPASPSPTAPRRSPTPTATARFGPPPFTATPAIPARTPTKTPTRPVPTSTPTAQSTQAGGG